MKDEFATFEIAKTLKELGFNEKCLGCYYTIPNSELRRLMFHDVEFDCDSKIKAPLWQQVEKFLWEKYKAFIEVVDVSTEDEDGHLGILEFEMSVKQADGYLEVITGDCPRNVRIEGITKAVEYLDEEKS